MSRKWSKGAQRVGGAKVERSTRTWSPISSVFSMEPEGISKFWKTKAWAKMTRISRVQMEASDSSGVSVWDVAGEDVVARDSAGVVSVGVMGVVNGISRSSSVYRLLRRGGICG